MSIRSRRHYNRERQVFVSVLGRNNIFKAFPMTYGTSAASLGVPGAETDILLLCS